MRLHVCAVGRLRTGPERLLTDDYTQRFNRSARPLGLGPLTEHEVEDRKGGGIAAEAEDEFVTDRRPRGERPEAKCNHVSARSMEIFRRLGVAKALREAMLASTADVAKLGLTADSGRTYVAISDMPDGVDRPFPAAPGRMKTARCAPPTPWLPR